ncbi:hypothetical protein MMC07_002648 [Pseudocyphellaria aurata]|nr:hypothetical protein [Pseudocyphellaria aurata]
MDHIIFCDNPDVVLYVGTPAVAFHVEMKVLCNVSPVLKAAFTGGYKESQNKTMDLPEEEMIGFDRFLRWAYLGSYPLAHVEADNTAEVRIMELARLYVLADRFDVVLLKHDIIDRMFEIGNRSSEETGPSHQVIRYVFNNSTRLSLFRKLLVAWHLKRRNYGYSHDSRMVALENEIPELRAEMALEARYRGPINPFARNRSVFYEEETSFTSRFST